MPPGRASAAAGSVQMRHDARCRAASRKPRQGTFYKSAARRYVVAPCLSSVPECVPVSRSSAMVTRPFTSTKR